MHLAFTLFSSSQHMTLSSTIAWKLCAAIPSLKPNAKLKPFLENRIYDIRKSRNFRPFPQVEEASNFACIILAYAFLILYVIPKTLTRHCVIIGTIIMIFDADRALFPQIT